MTDRTTLLIILAILGGMAAVAWTMIAARSGPDPETIRRAYATPAPPPGDGLRVFHLGHSLVGRDMPAMLQQLAGTGHAYESQLGWGTSLMQHWEPDEPIKGFDEENAHPRFRPAHEAVGSGDYDAVVLTEMVEIRDAIKYHDSGSYFPKWAASARAGNAETRVYLYETWPRLDDPDGWLTRLDRDVERYWTEEILLRDLAVNAPERPAYLIPAGQVMAAFVRALESRGSIGAVQSRQDLFRRTEADELDPIHVNDLGAYLVALTHYAVLYQRSPVGLPHELRRADGTPAAAPSEEVARLMQRTVWEVVKEEEMTGVPQ
ncbi:hypothetical protein [Roseovarius salinarum]|uniref:hypothetical protein n=1 Tax=Roseovarius salinarum TaxID=1981892 RepID=UPI001E4D0FB1|nr:hypothetical protein [Roseovarius salinarum]